MNVKNSLPIDPDKVQSIKDAVEAFRPNILMIMVDQLQYPQAGYGSAGFANDLKQILSFLEIDSNNTYAQYFPGLRKLREHAVVFTDHTIAESACIPSRASIMTGQYGPRTGVTQTDGLFKPGEAQNFPWLHANGTPTAGDWFRQLGYSTHYFGKWHTSDPPEHTLQGFGFADWELSWPEPHGSSINNLGAFRDFQFADLAASFLLARGLGVPYNRALSTQANKDPLSSATPQTAPFFAVVSFTNPHDIATYPTLPRLLNAGDSFDPTTRQWKLAGPGDSVTIPVQGQSSTTPTQGAFTFDLNPNGFPQNCATASPSQDENLLVNKPRAQQDYSYKVGLGLAAKTGLSVANSLAAKAAAAGTPFTPEQMLAAALQATFSNAIPFQIQSDPDGATVGFLQYYGYMISMVDRHILTVLEALEASGLRDKTVVVFLADHGEYGGAHSMMIEKWHGAYQETVAVPFLVSHRHFNPSKDVPIQIKSQTSHLDVLPTLLGLAKATADELETARTNLSMTHRAAALPGVNLVPIVQAGSGEVFWPNGKKREGVMFVTDDMITEPLPKDDDPHNQQSWQQYEVFKAAVEILIKGSKGEHGIREIAPVAGIYPGPVVQPCHVRALRSGDWKLVRYCDPWSEKPVADEWEFYNLAADPTEMTNLVQYNASTFPTVIPTESLPNGVTKEDVVTNALRMRAELAIQEAELLSPYPAAHPSSGAK